MVQKYIKVPLVNWGLGYHSVIVFLKYRMLMLDLAFARPRVARFCSINVMLPDRMGEG